MGMGKGRAREVSLSKEHLKGDLKDDWEFCYMKEGRAFKAVGITCGKALW